MFFFCLGLLKKAIRARPDLKVIITSATLDIKKFSEYFNAPMVKIPGKMFPVSIEYQDHRDVESIVARAKETENYLNGAIDKVLEIHEVSNILVRETREDLALFLPS
jgi:HrpA-like RNA helicase